MQVKIVYADTLISLRNRQGLPFKWNESDAVKFLNKHGWRLRGRSMMIIPTQKGWS